MTRSPLVSKRLTLTERELKRRGSASYLPEVDKRCPRVAARPARQTRRAASPARGAETPADQDLARPCRPPGR